MKLIEIEKELTEYTEFNVQFSVDDVMNWLGEEYANVPEGETVREGPFFKRKYGNNISISGNGEEFLKMPWWNKIKDKLYIISKDDSADIWDIDFIDV